MKRLINTMSSRIMESLRKRKPERNNELNKYPHIQRILSKENKYYEVRS